MTRTTKQMQRNSSIELFRILATFLVVIVHFNGWFIGGLPEVNLVFSGSSHRVGQAMIGSLCACCVNCFLLITGYFGIKLKTQSIYKLTIQLLGIFIPFYLIAVSLGYASMSVKTLIHNCLPISRGGYFVECYFLLMLISPFINAFIDRNNRKTVLYFTIIFVCFEFWFDGILQDDNLGFMHGYSTLHFCLIYVIGRVVRLYQEDLRKLPRYLWVVLYLCCCSVTFVLYAFNVPFALFYTSPFVIASTICLFMPFMYSSFHNKWINWFAAGCFAVYIIQVIDPAFTWLCSTDKTLLQENPYYLYLIKGGVVIVGFVIVCVLYDKVRGWVTKPLDMIVYPRLKKIDEKFSF